MKKNFFKKLSFVLAFAMVLSVLAPASGVFAAKAPKLNAKSKYLHLAEDSEYGANKFNFNIDGTKGKGWKYAWTSSDKKVATVNAKNGVTTAKGAGTATITVKITDKDGKKVDNLKAKVTVRDNIAEVFIKPLVDGAVIGVGEGKGYDFDRTYVTEAGLEKGSKAITRWTVEQDGEESKTATIDDKGNFVAERAGEYEIVARSFQSVAKYEAWLKDPVANADFVTAIVDEPYKVEVVASIVATNQIDKTSFTVEFDSDMRETDLTKVDKIYQVINGKQISTGTEKIKKISLDDATGKIATVEMHAQFNPKAKYQFVYGDLVGEFDAAAVDAKEIVEFKFKNPTINVTVGKGLNVLDQIVALNANGVEIFTGAELGSKVSFDYKDDKNAGFLSLNTLYVYEAGIAGTLDATYIDFIYNSETFTYDTIEKKASAVTFSTTLDDAINASSIQYVLSDTAKNANDDVKWANEFVVAKGESQVISTRYKTNDNADAYQTADSSFVYKSSDTDVAIIAGVNVYFVKEGKVTILVYKGDNVVGSFDVRVIGSRVLDKVVPEGDVNVRLGNAVSDTFAESRNVTFKLSDNLDNPVANATVAANYVSRPDANATLQLTTPDSNADGKAVIGIKAEGSAPGLYVVKLTFESNNVKRELQISVVVLDSTNKTVVRWAVEIDNANVDLKDGDKVVAINVYGYNANGARVEELTRDGGKFGYDLKVVKGSENITSSITGTSISASALGVGNYNVLVTVPEDVADHTSGRGEKAPLAQAGFVIKDSTKKEVIVKKSVITTTETIADAFTFKLNDSEKTGVSSVTYRDAAGKEFIIAGSGNLPQGNILVLKATVGGVEFEVNKVLTVK